MPVASDAEVQAMLARLKRRVESKVTINPSGVAQSPQAKSKLEWEKPVAGATGVKTKCGRYSCSKVTVNGKVNYELWRLVPGGTWFVPINQKLDNFMQAQTLAQQDLDSRV